MRLFGAVVALVMAVALPGLASVVHADERSMRQAFPSECRGFLHTDMTELVGVWGDYHLASPRWILALAFSPDGTRVLSGGAMPGEGALEGATLKLWDVESGQEVRSFQGHTRRVKSVAFSPNGRLALSGSTDGTARIWDLAADTRRTLKQVSGVRYPLVDAVAFSPDGTLALIGTSEQPGLRLLEVTTGHELRTFDAAFGAASTVFSPDGRFALSASSYEPPKLWEVASGKLVRTFELKRGRWLHLLGSRGAWGQAALSPDGRLIVAGNSDSHIRLWDAATADEIRVLRGHRGRVASVSFSPDGKWLLSTGSEDHTIRLWDLTSGTEIDHIDLVTSEDVAYAAAFSPTGESFIAGTRRGVMLHFKVVK